MTYESASSGPGEQFRLSRIRPDVPRANMVSPTTHYSAPMWDVPQPQHFRLPRFETSIITVSAICIALSIYGYISLSNASTTAYLAFLASFPLVVVLGFFIHLDRHEPEPLWTKSVAFVWGAGVAIVGASVLNSALLLNATLVLGDEMEAMRWTAVYVAPPVEETLKALGVLFIILARRSTIHSLIDGIVYAGFSGAGFAFIENIQYFLQASQEGSAALTVTVILRGVFSPFLHPMATSFTGLALAFALIRIRSWLPRTIVSLLGLTIAMYVHGLWNYAGTSEAASFITNYLFVEIPLFVGWMIVLTWISRRELKTVREGLIPYVQAGWVLPAEVVMVSEKAGRRTAMNWVKPAGKDAQKAMRRFLSNLAALGLDQKLQERLGADDSRIELDRQLVAQVSQDRQFFLNAMTQTTLNNAR